MNHVKLDHFACERLALAIILQAVKDFKRGGPNMRQDALRFFQSQYYEDLVIGLGRGLDGLPLAVKDAMRNQSEEVV